MNLRNGEVIFGHALRNDSCAQLPAIMKQISYFWNILISIPLLLGVPVAQAGIGPQNVVVVVNDNSRDSLEIGQYYQDQRGLSERQIVHVSTTTNGAITLTDFNSEIYDPVIDYINSSALSNQVETILYTIGMPYQVGSGGRSNGITSVTYYGFKAYDDPSTNTCSLPDETSNSYYEAEADFRTGLLASEGINYQSAVLSGLDLGWAKTTVDRAIAADHSFPTGDVYFVHTSDTSRNVRWNQYENSDFLLRQVDVPQTGIFRDANSLLGEGPIAGYMIGMHNISSVNANTYSKGALGHHLTSFGGILFNTPASQMSILLWLQAGCAGAYGTVVEPCNFTNKFPSARVHYWYARGFPMAESFYLSVKNPYMGLVVGDPMCQPYAVAPFVGVGGDVTNQSLFGIVSLTASGQAAFADQRVDRLDLFLDDILVTTLTNVTAEGGEEVTVDVDGVQATYTVLGGDGVLAIAAGLAASVEAEVLMPVSAYSRGDRVQLVQDSLGVAGAGITLSASESGPGIPVVHARASGPSLIESVYPARQRISASGLPVNGNSLRLRVTLLDNITHGNRVFRQAGEDITDLMVRLADAVNNDPDLMGSDGVELKYINTFSAINVEAYVVARTKGWDTYNIQTDYDVLGGPIDGPNYDGPMLSNESVMSARGAVFISLGVTNLVGSYDLDTTLLEDGPHTLRITAYDGSSVRSQGHHTVPFIVANHSLTCSLDTPATANAFLENQDLHLDALATGGAGTVTSVQFFVEGKIAGTDLSPPYRVTVNLAQYGVGTVGVQALAANDAGERALSSLIEILILDTDDTDADGLPDGWELLHFNSLPSTDGTGDADADFISDYDEFVADTDPNDFNHFFIATDTGVVGSPQTAQVTFVSNPTRNYEVEVNESPSLKPAAWLSKTAPFPGEPGQTTWTDTNAVPSSSTGVVYRVRAAVP